MLFDLIAKGVLMPGAKKQWWHSVALVSGSLLSLSLFLTQVSIVCLSPNFQSSRQRAYEYCITSLFSIIGAAVGWFLGIVVSPRESEDKRFAVVGSAIATFFSGFLISKFDALFDLLKNPGPAMPNRATLIIRASFSVAWFMVALTITFLTRSEEADRLEHPPEGNTAGL
jgi:hypothetical protein